MRRNYFSDIYIESDDDLHDEKRQIEMVQKKRLHDEKKRLSSERRILREIQKKKIKDEKYNQKIKITKIWSSYNTELRYIIERKEDDYNIAKYIGLPTWLQNSIFTDRYIGWDIIDRDEYLFMVEMMEKAKNPYWFGFEYDSNNFLLNVVKIQNKIENCILNIGGEFGRKYQMILNFFLFLYFDTVNYKKFLEYGKYYHLRRITEEEIQDIIENPYRSYNEMYVELIRDHFEVGKRYHAKRNNFKVLFRNYIRFIGKLMVIKKK